MTAALVCAACAVQRAPIGAGPEFLYSAGLVRVSDVRAVTAPAWAPDGRRLAFGTAEALWTVRAAAGDLDRRRLVDVAGLRRVAWSPDGHTLAAVAGNRLLAISLDDPSPRVLAAAAGIQEVAWPPGDRTAFARSAAPGPAYATSGADGAGVWTIRPGGRPVRLASLGRDVGVRGLAWLTGGAGLAVAVGDRDAAADRLVLVRPNGRGAFPVLRLPPGGRDPVASPDGRLLAYLEQAGADTRVAVVRAEGTGRRTLTPPGRYAGLAWSPAGTLVAYARGEGARAVLEIADVLTGERLSVGAYRAGEAAAGGTWMPPAIAWAPDGMRLAVLAAGGDAAGFIWLATLERR